MGLSSRVTLGTLGTRVGPFRTLIGDSRIQAGAVAAAFLDLLDAAGNPIRSHQRIREAAMATLPTRELGTQRVGDDLSGYVLGDPIELPASGNEFVLLESMELGGHVLLPPLVPASASSVLWLFGPGGAGTTHPVQRAESVYRIDFGDHHTWPYWATYLPFTQATTVWCDVEGIAGSVSIGAVLQDANVPSVLNVRLRVRWRQQLLSFTHAIFDGRALRINRFQRGEGRDGFLYLEG